MAFDGFYSIIALLLLLNKLIASIKYVQHLIHPHSVWTSPTDSSTIVQWTTIVGNSPRRRLAT